MVETAWQEQDEGSAVLEGGSEGKVVSENEAKWPELGTWLGPLELFPIGVPSVASWCLLGGDAESSCGLCL